MNSLQSADQPLLRVAGLVLLLPCVLLFVVALVGMIPFSLPDRMYPEFQLEKRRRLATKSDWYLGKQEQKPSVSRYYAF